MCVCIHCNYNSSQYTDRKHILDHLYHVKLYHAYHIKNHTNATPARR